MFWLIGNSLPEQAVLRARGEPNRLAGGLVVHSLCADASPRLILNPPEGEPAEMALDRC